MPGVSAFARTRVAGPRPVEATAAAAAATTTAATTTSNEFEVLAVPATSTAKGGGIFKLQNGAARVSQIARDVVVVVLGAGDSVALVGICKLTVTEGAVNLSGARLEENRDVAHEVFAPKTHALPVITGAGRHNIITLVSSYGGIGDFHTISEAFYDLWDFVPIFGNEELKATFQVISRNFKYDHKGQKSLVPFVPNQEWERSVAELAPRHTENVTKALVCGPKNTGKSTMVRYIANTLLSPLMNSGKQWSTSDGVAIIDIDPGQPEFGAPGTLSLVHLHSPLFGPSYTHPLQQAPLGTKKDYVFYQYFFGNITPNSSPGTYVECISAMIAKYEKLIAHYPKCHLIVNASGWVTGEGHTILAGLFDAIKPIVVFHMSDTGPEDTIAMLRTTCESSNTKLNLIPTQASHGSRSAQALRRMQMQSYLHMRTIPTSTSIRWDMSILNNLRWDTSIMRKSQPKLWKYRGAPSQQINGVVMLAQRLAPDQIAAHLNGIAVGIVVMNDSTALLPSTGLPLAQVEFSVTDEGISYHTINCHRSIGLSPWKTECLGVGFVEEIRANSQEVAIYTPVLWNIVQKALDKGQQVVLVPLEKEPCPWAYDEEEYHRIHEGKMRERIENITKRDQHPNHQRLKDLHDPMHLRISREGNAINNPFGHSKQLSCHSIARQSTSKGSSKA